MKLSFHIFMALFTQSHALRMMQMPESKDNLDFEKTIVANSLGSTWFGLTMNSGEFQEQTAKGENACGFKKDCPAIYTAADIFNMVKTQRVSSARIDDALREIHNTARQECAGDGHIKTILQNGGWCYNDVKQKVTTECDIPFELPDGHVKADSGFVSALVKHVLCVNGDASCSSLSDFGAGVGQFGHALRATHPNLEYYGYDGAGNVEEFTKDYVKFIDLTKPLAFKRADWVISSEVGEHIPNQFENQVIANLHAHNCKGIVLTWAILGQHGKGHINCHSNEYLIKIFQDLGYKLNENVTLSLRASPRNDHGWLKKSSLVFDRINPEVCN